MEKKIPDVCICKDLIALNACRDVMALHSYMTFTLYTCRDTIDMSRYRIDIIKHRFRNTAIVNSCRHYFFVARQLCIHARTQLLLVVKKLNCYANLKICFHDEG